MLAELSTQTDSVVYYSKKALEYSPQWLLPYLKIGYRYSQIDNNLEAAEQWLEKAYALHPDSYIMQERLAWLRQWQGRTDEAIAICHRMIAMKPDLPNAYGTMVTNYWIRSEVDSMLFWAKKAVQVDWINGAHFGIIFVLTSTRRTQEAAAYADMIFNQDTLLPFNFKVGLQDALIYGLINSGHLDEALLRINLLKSKCRDWVDEYIMRSYWLKKGDFEQSKQWLLNEEINAVYQCDRSLASAWLGYIAAANGETRVAEAYFQKAVSQEKPFYWDEFYRAEDITYLYGRFLLDQGRFEESGKRFLQSCEQRRMHGWKGFYGLALLAAKQGRNTEALDRLEKALDNWYPEPNSILAEPLFAKIRKTKRFKSLMAKNFPPGRERR